MSTRGSAFKRNQSLILFILGFVIVFWLLYAFRSVIFPFILGLALVYLLQPLVSWVERKLPYEGRWLRAKRILIILVIFTVILGLVALLSIYLITVVVHSFLVLLNNVPEYISEGLETLQEWAESIRHQFPSGMQQQVDEFIVDVGTALGNAIQDVFMRGLAFIPTTFTLILGFVSLPIFIFYLLKDSRKISEGFYSIFSPAVAVHARKIIQIIKDVLGRYIRAQLLLGLAVASLVFLGLFIMDIELAPALAVFAGLTELIPILGPWIGGAVGVLVALATAPEKTLWVAFLYFIVQQFENIFLVPRIQGGQLRINPAFLMVLLVLGAYIAGIWGILLAAPLTATIVEIYKYVRESLQRREIEQLSET